MDLARYLAEKAASVDEALDRYLPAKTVSPDIIHQAMRYSIFAGGKRLRPVLVIAAAETVGGSAEQVLPTACALELIHTYSLIHDDLPAMDNDDYRRGQPTSHKVFGEAVAILAGDALLTEASLFITRNADIPGVEAHAVLQAMQEVMLAAGSRGMVGGQVMDILSENKVIKPDILQYIHSHKTGALFRAALRSGAILAGARDGELAAVSVYAEHLGMAFQITDDILDVTGSSELLGKPVGSDERQHKATYPAFFGIEQSRAMARDYVEKAITSLEIFDDKADPLRKLVEYLLEREK